MSKKIKKYVLPYFPYLIAFWFFSKCGTAYRMAAGANLGEKLFGMVKTTSISPVRQLLEIRRFISRLTVRPLPRLTAALTSGWGTPALQM